MLAIEATDLRTGDIMGTAKKNAPRRVVRTKKSKTPVIAKLSRAECIKLLARNNVGRLAYSHHNQVELFPIHYVYEDGWLYGRTSPGAKVTLLKHNHWIAFEVDEVKGLFDWQSVIVRGTFHSLSNGFSYEEGARDRALQLTRRLVPTAFRSEDPAPFRTVLFRIYIDEITGRAAKSK